MSKYQKYADPSIDGQHDVSRLFASHVDAVTLNLFSGSVYKSVIGDECKESLNQ